MSQVVWSINIMIGVLLVAVGYVIYWIFKYDEWYPNDIASHVSSEHKSEMNREPVEQMLNNVLMDYTDGSNDTAKQEELLQLQSDED